MKSSAVRWCLTLALVLVAAAASRLAAFPEPSKAGKAWQYEFSYDTPRPVAIAVPGASGGQTRWFWYMTYKVINNTGDERLFVPEITVATDQGQIIPAGKDVPPIAFSVIRQKVANPLLESPIDVIGRFLQGEDNAKEGVAIWPAFDPDPDSMTIFITGLSGEVAVTANPLTAEPVALRKTMMLDYLLPGKPVSPQQQTVKFKGETWIMR